MIPVVIEGDGDAPIADRLLNLVGLEIGTVYGRHGKRWLDARLANYNAAARFSPWLVLRDLNSDAPCAGELARRLLSKPLARMCFRVAVRAAEAWLMADREQMGEFLSVNEALVPNKPDELANPKLSLVNLARRSRRRAIREDMVPDQATSGIVGPGYTARIIEFASHHWRPRSAAAVSPSLARCINALERWTEA